MRGMHFPEVDLDEQGLALLLGELNHRISNLLMMVEAAQADTIDKCRGLPGQADGPLNHF